jgi:hypothetical protein
LKPKARKGVALQTDGGGLKGGGAKEVAVLLTTNRSAVKGSLGEVVNGRK